MEKEWHDVSSAVSISAVNNSPVVSDKNRVGGGGVVGLCVFSFVSAFVVVLFYGRCFCCCFCFLVVAVVLVVFLVCFYLHFKLK